MFENFSQIPLYPQGAKPFKFDPIVVFSLPKRFNGLDLAFALVTHRIQKIISNVPRFLCNYLEIGDDPTVEIWTPSDVWPYEQFQRFRL